MLSEGFYNHTGVFLLTCLRKTQSVLSLSVIHWEFNFQGAQWLNVTKYIYWSTALKYNYEIQYLIIQIFCTSTFT